MKRSDPEIDAHIARQLKDIESRAESLQAVVRSLARRGSQSWRRGRDRAS